MENGISDRPMTRMRRDDNAQAASLGLRPYTQQSRPPTSAGRMHRPPSARPPSAAAAAAGLSAIPPGTASRLASAMQYQPPPTRAGSSMGRPPSTAMSMMDRPVTQQGLSGLRSAAPRGPMPRQIQDKRYFQGLLQMKSREIGAEVQKLNNELEALGREQSTFLTYDRRAKEMALELTELQRKLGDLNLVVDKQSTDTSKEDVNAETKELQSMNERRRATIEQAFEERRQREAQIAQLEKEIQQERQMADGLLEAMDPTLRHRYSQMKEQNQQLQVTMDQLQAKLDSLTSRKAALEDQLSMSRVKQEAVHLHARLAEAESRRNQLLAEEQTRASPAQERETLLQRVKEDNAETASMERQLAELRETARRCQEEIDSLDQDLEESQSERHQKYRELRKREETIESFLATFEENRNQETERIEQLEKEVVQKLQSLSKAVTRVAHGLPDKDTLSAIQESLSMNETELDRSKQTIESLATQQAQLQVNLDKVAELETKAQQEMDTLRESMKTMQSELPKLKDLGSLRTACDAKREELLKKKEKLQKTYEAAKGELKRAQERNTELKKQLSENETYAQLSNLERKLSLLEQNNFAMREFVASKKSETDCGPIKADASKTIQTYNNVLKEALRPRQNMVF